MSAMGTKRFAREMAQSLRDLDRVVTRVGGSLWVEGVGSPGYKLLERLRGLRESWVMYCEERGLARLAEARSRRGKGEGGDVDGSGEGVEDGEG